MTKNPMKKHAARKMTTAMRDGNEARCGRSTTVLAKRPPSGSIKIGDA